MPQLLFIETFVLGAAIIAAIYHLVLFIQQRDKFLAFYSAYLFTLASYIAFKLLSNNYDPFSPTNNVWYYILEEVIQVTMVAVYVLFAAQTLEVVEEKSIVRHLMYVFFTLASVSVVYHVYGALIHGPGVKSHQEYAISRIGLVGIATVALILAWRIRTTVFQRTIIIGSLVYDTSGLLSIISFTQETDIAGLSGVEPYLAGCLLDIIIFSGALGYRLKVIAEEKNTLLKKDIKARIALENTRMRIASDLHDDIGSVLSSISVYGEAAKRSLEESNHEKTKNLLERIGLNARETMSNMSDIVWNINPLNDTPERLFGRMESNATILLSARNMELEFEADTNLFEFDFSLTAKQNIYLIFKEALNNSVKYSEAGKVSITIKKAEQMLEMYIFDNGKGFDVTKHKEGNGLKNIHRRTVELRGESQVSSSVAGTQTQIRLPLSALGKS